MRIVISLKSVFRRLSALDAGPAADHLTPRSVCPDAAFLIAAYPSGQSYTWGAYRSPFHGFAPAIGYDAYPGGSGY